MKKLKSCGVLIVRGQPIDSFLLMKHPTRLDLPKGHVDPGESEIQCALRELEEETGITASEIVLDETFQFRTQYTVFPKRLGGEPAEKTLVVFLGRLLHEVEIRPTEHASYEWRNWNPPHAIQPQTIDSLLAALVTHLGA